MPTPKPTTNLLASLSLSAVLLGAGGTGCVSQGIADDYQELLREKESQIVELSTRLEEVNDELAAARNASATGRASAQQLAELSAERDRLRAQLDQANALIEDLNNRPAVEMTVDAEVASALAELANRYPNLMRYDAQRGMIQMQSDLTFGSGSIDVSEGAAAALAQLAGVLNGEAAQAYDVRIVGHTDNVPVRLLEGRRFQNNWELSTFRSLAVKSVLNDAGVAENRLEAAGRGEHQPVVANTADGAQANRRVELFLVESAGRAPMPNPADAVDTGGPVVVPASTTDTPATRVEDTPDEPLK